jgi:hypothetical protein
VKGHFIRWRSVGLKFCAFVKQGKEFRSYCGKNTRAFIGKPEFDKKPPSDLRCPLCDSRTGG